MTDDTMTIMEPEPIELDTNGYRILPGWRVGHLVEESPTRSGLLVPAGTESTSDALSLVDIATGRRFWAVPTGAWRFLWPATGRVAVVDERFRCCDVPGRREQQDQCTDGRQHDGEVLRSIVIEVGYLEVKGLAI